jgi:cyclopropane fatty-acyl-phospholipid synthase-like methyltransferase
MATQERLEYMAKKWENLCERNKIAVNNYNKKQRLEGNQQFLDKQKEYSRAYYQRNKEKVNKHNSEYQKEKRKLAKAEKEKAKLKLENN